MSRRFLSPLMDLVDSYNHPQTRPLLFVCQVAGIFRRKRFGKMASDLLNSIILSRIVSRPHIEARRLQIDPA